MEPHPGRPDGLLLTYYGDDFTGSTDSMEAMALAGAPTMLFLEPPSPERLARHPGLAVVGVAGTSRSRPPEWMDAELPGVFRRLRDLGAPFNHYKTCSTFDSAPDVGSIGRAAEIGADVFGAPVPVIVGVERHKRYVMFSNLFAAGSISGTRDVFRIDRHPTMSRHPVTPMAEADLRLHLGRQTNRPVVGFDFPRMLAEGAEAALDAVFAAGAAMVVLDTFDDATTRAAGRLLAHRARRGPLFAVGSSGVEYALARHLAETGALPRVSPPGPAAAAERLIAVCGSCSPVTEAQIAWAEVRGFAVLAVDTVAAVRRDGDPALAADLAQAIRAGLEGRPGVVVHTARGGADPRIGPTRAALRERGLSSFDSAPLLGGLLGRALRTAVAGGGARRLVLAGGDSSSYAARAFGVEALEVAAPLVPGAPLCRVHSADPAVDGAEVLLKGGQVGGEDFFGDVLTGRAGG